MIWPICSPLCWPIAPGRLICLTLTASCPACGGWCGFIENGTYEDRLFPTPSDAPRRLPVPSTGFLLYPAITTAPNRFGPAPAPQQVALAECERLGF
jgi:hypothetical protein